MRSIGFSITDTVRTVIERMLVTSTIIACIIVMCTIVPACVCAVVIWTGEIEMIVIGIRDVNTEVPTVSTGIDGAVKILRLHKAGILSATKHPAEIVITYIQIVIISVECPLITI